VGAATTIAIARIHKFWNPLTEGERAWFSCQAVLPYESIIDTDENGEKATRWSLTPSGRRPIVRLPSSTCTAVHPGSACGGTLSPDPLRGGEGRVGTGREREHANAGRSGPRLQGKVPAGPLTIEDEGVFTMPWTATVTFGRGSTEWPEVVCVQNRHEFYTLTH
jgi:hypothetical protein